MNIEKKNQNIRDDILEMNEMMPSYTRQAKTESETVAAKKRQKELHGEVKVNSKRAIKELNQQMKTSGKLSLADDVKTK